VIDFTSSSPVLAVGGILQPIEVEGIQGAASQIVFWGGAAPQNHPTMVTSTLPRAKEKELIK
jgi:hypothetical protein